MMETVFSSKGGVKEALSDIQKGIRLEPALVLFFASTKYDLESLGKGLEQAYPQAKVIGCSTSGELVSGHMLKSSVVASAFDHKTVSQVQAVTLKDLSSKADVTGALSSLEKKVGKKLSDLDLSKYVGIILIDGLRAAEERVMDSIGNHSDLTWIGGSAGDDLQFKETRVFADGRSMTDAAVLAVLKVDSGFDIIKTQSFKVTPKKLTATEVDERTRTVVKFNGKPALAAYAEAVGTAPAKASDSFMKNPVGLVVNGEPFVRSPQRVDGDKMVFYCNIKKGAELSVLESTNIVADTQKAVQEKLRAMGHVSGLINFNCILRTLELDAKNQAEAYGNVFKDVPTVGFSTYGEEYIGHINQTATMLVLK